MKNKIHHEAFLHFIEQAPMEKKVEFIERVERENDSHYKELIESFRILIR